MRDVRAITICLLSGAMLLMAGLALGADQLAAQGKPVEAETPIADDDVKKI